jgi:hypothetical protein
VSLACWASADLAQRVSGLVHLLGLNPGVLRIPVVHRSLANAALLLAGPDDEVARGARGEQIGPQQNAKDVRLPQGPRGCGYQGASVVDPV